MQNERDGARKRAKGQALIEVSILGVVLVALLAGIIDFGRAYYTSIVVTQMAGEGASYAAWYPDHDLNYTAAGTCSQLGNTTAKTIQERARLVAVERGLVFEP